MSCQHPVHFLCGEWMLLNPLNLKPQMAIDYFTKWIEATSYCNVTRGVVLKFIKKEQICRLLEGIITDNAKNLNNKMMDELWTTPFSLVYGMEAVLPFEVEIPLLRVLMEAEWIRGHYEQLNFVEEKRLATLSHGQLYQRRLMRAYNKKVHSRSFQEGDLVLKRIFPFQKDHREKWTPNYEGPFVVKKAFSGGALLLTNMDDVESKNIVNSDYVQRYYA
ncbi:Gypsy retrotransposon integrase-like protein 1 [Cucumis melo var. makuwa]|uniref:Gypsy retrotransposon integrase-like protein 1 n=1 Tax=Cucumis melo var. makuwa TaxID=1194695 RepID=A0A5D3DNF8_CUCMM|nr:Gypsy retrotransposon integrase-like protein 1 [Cucumis melo var. makuwa]TYK24839.1 Gypsy retrotransposon integrase-like protein 1 [Cucumis melo var. makuwa]